MGFQEGGAIDKKINEYQILLTQYQILYIYIYIYRERERERESERERERERERNLKLSDLRKSWSLSTISEVIFRGESRNTEI